MPFNNLHPYLITFQQNTSVDMASLFVAEHSKEIPFTIHRVFWLSSKEKILERGHHAHFRTEQVLIALEGEVKVQLESLEGVKQEFLLCNQGLGLFIPPLWWHVITYSPKSSIMVLASTIYNERDYIRDYNLFKCLKIE